MMFHTSKKPRFVGPCVAGIKGIRIMRKADTSYFTSSGPPTNNFCEDIGRNVSVLNIRFGRQAQAMLSQNIIRHLGWVVVQFGGGRYGS